MEQKIYAARWLILNITNSRLSRTHLQKNGEKINNISIRIYVNKIEKRITFRIKVDIILNF